MPAAMCRKIERHLLTEGSCAGSVDCACAVRRFSTADWEFWSLLRASTSATLHSMMPAQNPSSTSASAHACQYNTTPTQLALAATLQEKTETFDYQKSVKMARSLLTRVLPREVTAGQGRLGEGHHGYLVYGYAGQRGESHQNGEGRAAAQAC